MYMTCTRLLACAVAACSSEGRSNLAASGHSNDDAGLQGGSEGVHPPDKVACKLRRTHAAFDIIILTAQFLLARVERHKGGKWEGNKSNKVHQTT